MIQRIAIALLLVLACAAVVSAQETVTVDLSVNNGAATQPASGFLHGISSTTPSNALVNPMSAKFYRMDDNSWGGGCGGLCIDSALYARIVAQGAKPEVILGDLWIDNVDGKNPSNARVVTSGTMSAFLSMVTDVLNATIGAGQTVQWDIWNEPDNTAFWTGSEAQYQAMWLATVPTIRGISASQQIVGPSTCGCIQGTYNGWSTWATDLMAFATTNSVLMNIVSFHENDSVALQVMGIASAQAYLAANNPSITKIEINEYGSSTNSYLPGTQVQYLASAQRSNLWAAARACWTTADCFMYTLDGLLQSDSVTTRAAWYAYQAYANQLGTIVGTTPSATVDGVSSQNCSAAQSAGGVYGRAGATTDVTFTFTHLSSACGALIVGGVVHVTLLALANDNGSGSTGPTTISSGNVTVSGDAISVTYSSMGTDNAAIVVLAPGGGVGPTTNFYFSQSGSGAQTGTSCASQLPVSFFNTSGNWGGSAGQIGPNGLAHVGGAITTTLTFQGSGTSGNPITLVSDCGGMDLTQPFGTLINLNGQSNLVVDGAGTGVIENTANGAALANQVNVQGIQASGASNFEIKNLTCRNIYVAVPPTAAAGIDDTLNNCVYANGAGGTISIHDSTFDGAGWLINIGGLANGSVVQVYNMVLNHFDHGIVCGDGSNSYTCFEHDNHFEDSSNWDTTLPSPGDWYHHDPIHLYNGSGGPGSWGTDIYWIYNNLYDGNRGQNFTADIFYENGSSTEPQVHNFNDVHIQTPGVLMSNGFVAVGDGNALGSLAMLNNTFLCDPTVSGQGGVRIIATALTFKNNVISGCNNLLSVESGSSGGSGIDYNIYANQGAGGNYRWNWEAIGGTNTFATWQSNCGTGCDAHSSYNASAGLSVTGTVNAGSVVIGAGTNLTSLGVTALDCDTTAGNTRTCTARPAMGAWTVSAYTYGGAAPPGAPHGLRVLSIQ